MAITSKIYAKEILNDIKNKRIIPYNREKNMEFFKKYNIKQKNIEDIIYGLTKDFFKGKIENKDKHLKTEYLYYFKALVNLNDEFGEITKYIYIKICEIDKNIIVVSLHEDE